MSFKVNARFDFLVVSNNRRLNIYGSLNVEKKARRIYLNVKIIRDDLRIYQIVYDLFTDRMTVSFV